MEALSQKTFQKNNHFDCPSIHVQYVKAVLDEICELGKNEMKPVETP